LEIQLLQTEDDFEKIKAEWNNLLEKSNNNSVFPTWEWLYNRWIHFKKDRALFILLARSKSTDEIAGIAPFYIQKTDLFNFFKVKKIKFLVWAQKR
jgi:hypothetical protein